MKLMRIALLVAAFACIPAIQADDVVETSNETACIVVPTRSTGDAGDIYLSGHYIQNYNPSKVRAFFRGVVSAKTAVALMGVASLPAMIDFSNEVAGTNILKKRLRYFFPKDKDTIMLSCIAAMIVPAVWGIGAFCWKVGEAIGRKIKGIKQSPHQFRIDIRSVSKKCIKNLLRGCDQSFIDHVLATRKEANQLLQAHVAEPIVAAEQ